MGCDHEQLHKEKKIISTDSKKTNKRRCVHDGRAAFCNILSFFKLFVDNMAKNEVLSKSGLLFKL